MFDRIEIAVAFSTLGAFANLANRYLTGSLLTFKVILSNLLISAFAAALMYLIALRPGWQFYGFGGVDGRKNPYLLRRSFLTEI